MSSCSSELPVLATGGGAGALRDFTERDFVEVEALLTLSFLVLRGGEDATEESLLILRCLASRIRRLSGLSGILCLDSLILLLSGLSGNLSECELSLSERP